MVRGGGQRGGDWSKNETEVNSRMTEDVSHYVELIQFLIILSVITTNRLKYLVDCIFLFLFWPFPHAN